MKITNVIPVAMLLLTTFSLEGSNIIDAEAFDVFERGTRLNEKGWKTVYARNGGFGKFPASYTYRAEDIDGTICLIDAYDAAQNHAHATAIPLDWDGDPANGQTAISVSSGTRVVIQVSVYLQAYALGTKQWGSDGTGSVQWSMAPGIWRGEMATNDTGKTYDWARDRGPRIQYRMGNKINGAELPFPEICGYAPESSSPAAVDSIKSAGSFFTNAGWYELRLSVVFKGAAAECSADARVRNGEWQRTGSWTFAIKGGPTAENPANWNALYLDLENGQWSKKGYGPPEASMRDRYDDLSVAVSDSSQGTAQAARIFMFDRPVSAAFVRGKETLFADEAPLTYHVSLVNGGMPTLSGTLLLRSSLTPYRSRVIASCALPLGKKADYSVILKDALMPGDHILGAVLSNASGERTLGSLKVKVLPQLTPKTGMNLVRNGSFELPATFLGSPMRQADETFQMHAKKGGDLYWSPLTEGWWAEGTNTRGFTFSSDAHSGKIALRLATSDRVLSCVSSLNRLINPGPVTLSLWAKTAKCKGRVEFDLIEKWDDAGEKRSAVRRSAALPSDGDYTRISVTVEAPKQLQAIARLVVEEGTAAIDDVQIESGAGTAFNVRPEERLRLSFGDDSRLPQWVVGDTVPRTVTVIHDSRTPMKGTARIFLGPWHTPFNNKIAEFEASTIAPGSSKTIPIPVAGLLFEAYLITLSVDGEDPIPPSCGIATGTKLAGSTSGGMILARTAARFIVVPDIKPTEIFGVGNAMIQTCGDWFGGYALSGYAAARPLGITTLRSRTDDESCYLAAAAGAFIHGWGSSFVDYGIPVDAPFANPVNKKAIDLANPDGSAFFAARTKETGKDLAQRPIVASYQMANEAPYINRGSLCPTEAADASFRAWCKERYGNIEAVNAKWGTKYASEKDIEQIASARFLEEERDKPRKEGADWLAGIADFSPQVRARMTNESARAMDWLRWRTAMSLKYYSFFRTAAKENGARALFGNNLCWPAFWPQLFMPFIRAMDNVQLDIQYTAAFPRTLGSPMEMMDCMEMAESTDPAKPVWGVEIYVQPHYPAEFTAMQNWGMIAHGMANNLVFAWKPYSDAGPIRENRAWDKSNARPMWFLIDFDGSKLPAYDAYQRSMSEISGYHAAHHGLSVKRAPTRTAFYVSSDTGEYVMYHTGNKPWDSVWQRTRNHLIYALRMAGVSADYVDDTTLPSQPNPYTTLVVPASYILSQNAAAKIASFATSGGTVILAGMSGIADPWLKKYNIIGGEAWRELNWRAPDFSEERTTVSFGNGRSPLTSESNLFRGVNIGDMRGAAAIQDAAGATIGFTRTWGKGKIVAYGVFIDRSGGDPHLPAGVSGYIAQLISLGGLSTAARWIGDRDRPEFGRAGEGSEVVEVVLREKSAIEKFVFCLNQGGAGDGVLEVNPGTGPWKATDVITGKPVEGEMSGAIWRSHLRLAPFGYRILRLTK